MAQNVGPILNMVTAKYLLRGRGRMGGAAREPARSSTRSSRRCSGRTSAASASGRRGNWDGPLKRIIPWVTNEFTETIIREARAVLGDDFWGFLMLGGMSGGGMAFFVAPHRHDEFQDRIAAIMRRVKADARRCAAVRDGAGRLRFPHQPRRAHSPRSKRAPGDDAAPLLRASGPADDRHASSARCPTSASWTSTISPNRCPDTGEICSRVFRTMVNHLFPVTRSADGSIRRQVGRRGRADPPRERFRPRPARTAARRPPARRIGLARNRLPVDVDVRDVNDADLIQARARGRPRHVELGERPSPAARSPS